jgi:hypothetical protein
MKKDSARRMRWSQRLRRELIFWRVIGLSAIASLCLGFAQDKSPREIKLVSADGRQSVVLSGQGIYMYDKTKELGHLGFEGVGDGDDLEVNLKLAGQVTTCGIGVYSGNDRLFLSADRIGFLEKGAVRASLFPYGLLLQDHSGQSKIALTTPDQGTGGLDFVEHGNMVLSMGALAHFRVDNPPLRNEGAIHIADFAKDFKSRLITASESELHTNH